MSTVCARCLRTNPDAVPVCQCGHALGPFPTRSSYLPVRLSAHVRAFFANEMRKRDFLLGIGIVWVLLSLGEWLRIPPELRRKTALELVQDCLVMGLTDLAGALVIGAVGWLGTWVVLACEDLKISLCPKRITFAATLLGAGLAFGSRGVSLGTLLEYYLFGSLVAALSILAYFAGSRGWLSKQ